jgi:hypothetical protein
MMGTKFNWACTVGARQPGISVLLPAKTLKSPPRETQRRTFQPNSALNPFCIRFSEGGAQEGIASKRIKPAHILLLRETGKGEKKDK